MSLISHPQVQKLIQRYEYLSQRDRIGLNGLLLLISVLLIYSLVWLPSNHFFEKSKQNYEKQKSVLRYLQATERQARAASGQSGKSVAGQSLLQMVSRSAQKARLKPNRLQPEGDDGVSVWLNAVSFNVLIQWLEDLSLQGFSVRQISIDRGDEPGLVNARIILRS